ncbi:MAG: tetratricopeptide repeat protein [Candidatus Omnitrophica bacterium]|nr:tetratricopeptide repeat protein [Candidatus Omnitrophota bacterium]
MFNNYFIPVIFIFFLTEIIVMEFFLRKRQDWLLEKEIKELSDKSGVSENTFNIYYFGSSTMVGVPYDPALSIPKLVSFMLGDSMLNRAVCYVNLGKCAINFHYNLTRLRVVLKNKNIFYPSLCIFYGGHNEYLRYTKEYAKEIFNNIFLAFLYEYSFLARKIINRLVPSSKVRRFELGERSLFDQPLFEQKKYKEVISRYKLGVAGAESLLRKYKVVGIFSTLASNISDFEPNRSVFSGTSAQRDELKNLMELAKKELDFNNFSKAAELYSMALSLCSNFAEAHYQLGKCYQKQNNFSVAKQAFKKAVDFDAMPVRAVSGQNDFLRSLLNKEHVFVVDSEDHLTNNSADGLVGYDLMIDGNHPNIKGYILISQLIADKILEIFQERKSLNLVSEDEAKKLFGLCSVNLSKAYNYTGLWMLRFATWRYDYSDRLNKAKEYFLKAMSIDGQSFWPYLGLGLCNYVFNDVKKAQEYISQAEAINSLEVNNYLNDYWNKQVIKRSMQHQLISHE